MGLQYIKNMKSYTALIVILGVLLAIAHLPSAHGQCASVDSQGDGYCQDGNNNAACEWDGGDCCYFVGRNGDWNSQCTECDCLDPVGIENEVKMAKFLMGKVGSAS